ncbi:MAG: hypothetical protein AB1938_19575 [Myxococcota bacterium]
MKYLGGLLVLAWAAMHVAGYGRFPDEERGEVPASVRTAPGGILSWHSGFMGGK